MSLVSRDEIESELTAVRPDDFGELEFGSERIRPATCTEWMDLRKRGFKPPTTVAGAYDDSAKERCEGLLILEGARPSHTTYVRKLPWNVRLLSLLPAAIASALDPSERHAVAEATAAGKTFAQFDPRATAKRVFAAESLQIIEGDRNGTVNLYPLIYADLNRDGVEDIVISVTNGDAHGPMSNFRLLIAARDSKDAELRVLEWR